jgi:hypothetical protein
LHLRSAGFSGSNRERRAHERNEPTCLRIVRIWVNRGSAIEQEPSGAAIEAVVVRDFDGEVF